MGEAIWVQVQTRLPNLNWEEWINGLVPDYWELCDFGEDDGSVIYTLTGEGNYGLGDGEIETYCDALAEWKIPYIATSDPKYEYPGEIIIFDGDAFWYGNRDGDGAYLTHRKWKELTNGGTTPNTYAIEAYFTTMNRSISDITIEHLQDFPPPDEDDALSFDEVEDAGLDGTLRDM